MENTLILSAGLSVLVGIVYAYVGLRLTERQVSVDARPAHAMFVTFWLGLAGSSLISALTTGLYVVDRLPMWLFATITQVQIFLIILVLAALMYYLVYVYTGSNRWLIPLILTYFAFWVVLVGLIEWIPAPESLVDDGWTIMTEPEVELDPAVGLVFLFALIGPQVAGAIAYARLYGKATDNTQRYRIALVSGTIIIWFGISIAGSLLEAAGPVWNLFVRLLGLAAAFAILMAYLPPKALKAKWGLRSIADESPPGPAA